MKTSPSSRGRGLKFKNWVDWGMQISVALFTRAWIEIRMEKYINVYIYRRPLHEGVD